jgi:TolB-like protein
MGFSGPRDKQSDLSEQDVREQLNRILGHPEFHATDKMRQFLRYVVEETLAGKSEQIKGFNVAIEVFGRDADFDAAHDPVVRIQAGRLRRAIERYYLVGGQKDPIRIDIPKGTYVPVFTKHRISQRPENQRLGGVDQTRLAATCPIVLVRPFTDLTTKPELGYMGAGLATELSIHLGQCADLCVLKYRDDVSEQGAELAPDFEVTGSVQCDGRQIKIVAQLTEWRKNRLLWTEAFKAEVNTGSLIDFQERAASSITAHIAGEHGVIVRAMSVRNNRRPIEKLNTYQAVLKGYTYWDKVDASSYQVAFEALEREKSKGVDSGLVSIMLSLLYADNIGLEYFDLKQTPLDAALHLAREGNRLEPDNQLGYLALARVRMLSNDLAQARIETDKALAIQPESLLFIDAIGYMLIHLGDWDRGEELVQRAIRLNPFYRIYSRYGLWLNAFRQRDYVRALGETEWLIDIATFWSPLCRAVTLAWLGRTTEAHGEVAILLAHKPDFARRGRTLIGNYVKFPEISDQIIDGLAKAGLKID